MHQPDGTEAVIDQINRAAIGDVNTEANSALIGDQAIAIVEAFVRCGGPIDHPDPVSVDLLRGNEWRPIKSILSSDPSMNSVQPGERFRFIVRHLNPGDTPGETVNDAGLRAERGVLLSRELAGVHLPEVVVRVVRVVVWTGCLAPA